MQDSVGIYYATQDEIEFNKKQWFKWHNERYVFTILEEHLMLSAVEPDVAPPYTMMELDKPQRN